jgi:hypothetical protein
METAVHTTIEHDAIKRWALERGAHPAHVRAGRYKDEPGALRLDFSPNETSFETISWDLFFEHFEARNLAFRYREDAPDGTRSRYYELIDCDAI